MINELKTSKSKGLNINLFKKEAEEYVSAHYDENLKQLCYPEVFAASEKQGATSKIPGFGNS